MSWNTSIGRTCRLEFTDDPSTAWTPLGNVLAAQATPLSVSELTAAPGQRFYRVRLLN